MPIPEYDVPSSLKNLLEAEGLAMSKKFGQNFLVNRRQRERILAELKVESGSRVWEIGPGIGSMTSMALDSGLDLTAFEIDHGFARMLREIFGQNDNFRLVEGDFLRTWKDELQTSGMPSVIFGNLPYNVATAIIASIIENGELPGRMVFTVQKEAAFRIGSVPGTKDYSAFSVLCTSACKVKVVFDLGASSFWPAPTVTSSVVVLVPRRDPVMPQDRKGFSAFVRAGFSSRRKTLRNNLRAYGGMPADPVQSDELLASLLASIGKPADVRAEALIPEELAAVYAGIGRQASIAQG